jgi:hypothetical protein
VPRREFHRPELPPLGRDHFGVCGLTNARGRQCDAEARKLLGRRHVCVFSAPIRPAMQCATRQLASQVTHTTDGRRVGCQAWAIVRKIVEVDQIMRANPRLQQRVFEVHPEVSFAEWNGGVPFDERKKSRAGKAARQSLIGGRGFQCRSTGLPSCSGGTRRHRRCIRSAVDRRTQVSRPSDRDTGESCG